MWKQLQAGQEMVGGGRKGVLVNAPVDLVAHQLLRGGVRHCAHGHIGRGDAANVVDRPRDAEVGEESQLIIDVEISDDDVVGLDVSVQQAFLVGVVQRAGDSGNNRADEFGGHACRVALLDQLGCVGPVDPIHSDPQPAVVFSTIMYSDYVRMPQACGQVGFADKPLLERGVAGDVGP